MTDTGYLWPIYTLIILGLIGLLDATYLTASHFRDTAVICSLFEGCDVVLKSRYAQIAGIPTALLGALFYFFVCLGAVAGLVLKKESIIRAVAYLTIIGFLVSVILTYIQVAVIESLCQFCIISAITSTLLLVAGLVILGGKGRGNITSSLHESETVQ